MVEEPTTPLLEPTKVWKSRTQAQRFLSVVESFRKALVAKEDTSELEKQVKKSSILLSRVLRDMRRKVKP